MGEGRDGKTYGWTDEEMNGGTDGKTDGCS